MHHAMHLWRQVSVRMPENRQLERRQISEEARLLVRALWRASDVPRPLAHPPGASVPIQFTFPQSLHFVNLLRLLCRALHTFVCAKSFSTDARRNSARDHNSGNTADTAAYDMLECTPASVSSVSSFSSFLVLFVSFPLSFP